MKNEEQSISIVIEGIPTTLSVGQSVCYGKKRPYKVIKFTATQIVTDKNWDERFGRNDLYNSARWNHGRIIGVVTAHELSVHDKKINEENRRTPLRSRRSFWRH